MPGISYCTIGSNDLEKAKAFYDALLGSAGWATMMDLPTGSRIYGQGTSMFGVMRPHNGDSASAGNGSMTGFNVASADEVARFHAKALELGATDEGAPGERAPGMHFAYFRDPEGNKFCAYAIG